MGDDRISRGRALRLQMCPQPRQCVFVDGVIMYPYDGVSFEASSDGVEAVVWGTELDPWYLKKAIAHDDTVEVRVADLTTGESVAYHSHPNYSVDGRLITMKFPGPPSAL